MPCVDESPTLADPTLGWLLLSDDTHMRKEIHLQRPRLGQHSESSNEVAGRYLSHTVQGVPFEKLLIVHQTVYIIQIVAPKKSGRHFVVI